MKPKFKLLYPEWYRMFEEIIAYIEIVYFETEQEAKDHMIKYSIKEGVLLPTDTELNVLRLW